MFSNIGGKIKNLATVIFWIGIVISVISAITVILKASILLGILYLIMGFLFSWIGNFFLYAFGEIADNCEQQTAILKSLRDNQEKMNENLVQLQNQMRSNN